MSASVPRAWLPPDTGTRAGAHYFLGVDCGTQSLRVGLFDAAGNCVAIHATPTTVQMPHPGWVEQEPLEAWAALRSGMRRCIEESGVDPAAVRGIGVDSTSCTVVACDRSGVPITKAMLWMDQRAFDQARRITATGHPVLAHCGGVASAEWMLPKALWLKENSPDDYDRSSKIVEISDFLVYRLTGLWVAAASSAAHKRHWLHRNGGWPREFYAAAGLRDFADKCPDRVVFAGQPAGALLPDVASELGLSPACVVANIGTDAHAALLGTGAVSTGTAELVLGTSTVVLAVTDNPAPVPGGWGPFADGLYEGVYVLDLGLTSTGAIIQWFCDNAITILGVLSPGAPRPSNSDAVRLLDAMAAEVAPGSDGLVLLDYWAGNRTPFNDPLARGAVWGMTLKHGPGALFRSILEGTAYGCRRLFESMEAAGHAVDAVYVGGGGARSRLWLQIHADVTGKPLRVSRFKDISTLGSAVGAAVACGHFPDLHSAAASMTGYEEVIQPRPHVKQTYDFYYARYVATYERLADLMHDVSLRSVAATAQPTGLRGEPRVGSR